MRIVQIIARMNVGGTSKWIESLIEGLNAKGHETYLMAGYVADNEIEDESFKRLNGIRIESMGRKISVIQDLKSILILRRKIFKIRPDIVNTHTFKAGLIGRLAAFGSGAKIIHTYHGHLLYGYFSPVKVRLWILIEKILARISNALVVVGEQVRQELIQAKIATKEKFIVINVCVEGLNFCSRNDARNILNLSEDEFVIGWLGRLTKIKRPDRLVELSSILPDYTFIVGGSGEMFTSLNSNKPGNVKLLGYISPEIFWPTCDVAILTSDNEGMPTSLVEAEYFGIPIVSWKVGSVAEVVIQNHNGLLVDNIHLMGQAIEILHNNENLRKKMGENGKSFARQKFSKQNFIDSHLNAYNVL